MSSKPVERSTGAAAPCPWEAADSLDLQLQLLAAALDLSSAGLLWAPAGADQLRLLAVRSRHRDIARGPFPLGRGICGAIIRGHDEITMVDVSPAYNGIPYHDSPSGTGTLFACRLPGGDRSGRGEQPIGILIAERGSRTAWSEAEKDLLRRAACKLAQDLDIHALCQSLDRERSAIQTICDALRELNRGLGLDSVFSATARAVRNFVDADFTAISLIRGENHYAAFVRGRDADVYKNMEYDIEDGLVGQVLKLQHPLPANATYNGPAPVFSSGQALEGYRSLYILPLCREDGAALGTLTVAAGAAGVYGEPERDILQLIAGQVAIKIDLAQSHEKISRMATTDGLTGLANHRTFQHAFDVMLHRARRRQSPVSLIFCDIDYFKSINDSHGHPFGDKVLQAVAKILSDAVRKEDLAARYGGEEFAILLENSDKHGALQMAERIRADIAALGLRHDRRDVRVTISLGIAAFPADGSEKSEIIDKADQALYRAKNGGRNRTVVHGGAA